MRSIKTVAMLVAILGLAGTAGADFTAFNDTTYEAGFTHANTTLYSHGGTSGLLKDITTGLDTPVTVTITEAGISWQNYCAEPAAGTDAANMFGGYVGFRGSNNGGPGGGSIEVAGAADHYTYTFTGLNPALTYNFAGTAIRGGYDDRWSTITLDGADAYTNAHSTGAGVVAPGTGGLAANQVAIHVGRNSEADQGYIAYWTDIAPGDDGTISVISQQYVAGGGTKGYGLHGIMLQEVPEPATMSLLALGGLALLRRRRRK